MSRKPKDRNINPAIVVAVLGLIGTVITAVLSSPVLVAKIQNAPAPTSFVEVAPTSVTNDTYASVFIVPGASIPNTANEGIENIVKYGTDWFYSWNLVQMPEGMDPSADPKGSLDKTIVSVSNKDIKDESKWLPISPGIKLILNMQNIQGKDGLDIKVAKQAVVSINDYSPAESHVNAIGLKQFVIPVTGGGGLNYNLSSVQLDPMDWREADFDTALEGYDYVILEPGQVSSFAIELSCKQPGIYRMVVKIRIFYGGENHDLFFDPPARLNCPRSFTLWKYQSLSDNGGVQYQWQKLGDYIFQDGKYMEDKAATPYP